MMDTANIASTATALPKAAYVINYQMVALINGRSATESKLTHRHGWKFRKKLELTSSNRKNYGGKTISEQPNTREPGNIPEPIT